MPRSIAFRFIIVLLLGCTHAEAADPRLRLEREANWLIIRGMHLPGGEIRINYLEAYCRPNSADADWGKHTVIPHTSRLLSKSGDGGTVRMRDLLSDGVSVEHVVSVDGDGVAFRLSANNPTAAYSQAHWAQPCVRLGAFTGHDADHRVGDADDYLPKCFVFIGGKLARMPTPQWRQKRDTLRGRYGVPPTFPRLM